MANGNWEAPKPRPYRFQIENGHITSNPTVATLSNYSVPGNEVYLSNNHIRFNFSGIVRINVCIIGQASDNHPNSYRLWTQIVKDTVVESTAYVHLAAGEYASANHGVTLYVTPSTDIYYNFMWMFKVGSGFNSVPSIIEVLVL